MKPQIAATAKWMCIGGELKLPDGWFVYRMNCDLPEPYICICNEDTAEEREMPVSKALAYFLSTHDCGSEAMKQNLSDFAKRKIQNDIKDVLGI